MSKIAIKAENVSKTFTIPHEKISTLRGAFVSAFRKKTYEKFKALDGVSFEVKKGEFFGIIGRNGSGKSTLLKILAGIYTTGKGSVKVNGRISPFLELGIGFNPELSGRDNIYLNASVLGLSKKQIDNKFDDIVAFSELGRFIDQKVKNYSSGMNVRLAFSVAIHANREILLMDEVLAVGDTNFQSKCFEEFNKYRDQGKTVVLVTHDIGTVQRYCDRAMLLRNGRIEMIGDPEKVGNKYIYQNMSDEEKRIIAEEKRQQLKAEKEAREREKEAEKQKKEEEKRQKELTEQQRREEQEQREKERKEREEAAKKAREERKNKIAKITKVEFLDKNGIVKNVFKTGDDITIRVYFKREKRVYNLGFGIAIFNQENNYIFADDTRAYNKSVKDYFEKGYYQMTLLKVPLRTNTYFIKSGIFLREGNKTIDFLEKSKTFKILSDDKYQGLIVLNSKWK